MQRRSWWIASLLFLSTLLNYFDRQILSLISPVLRVQFALSARQYSFLLDAFLLGYTCMQFLSGWVVDRLGAKRGLLFAMIWWSSAGTAAAAARNPQQLALCLFLMGVGEGANWPTAVKAIREWFRPEARAIAVGFFNAGSSAGAVLAPLIVSQLTLHYSWRAAFITCGLLGVLWLGPWILLYRDPPFESRPKASAAGLSFLGDRRAWGLILARFFADSIWYFYVFWLPDYLTHVQLLSLKSMGAVAWIPFMAAAAGNFAGGAASGYLIRAFHRVVISRLAVMWVSAVIMAFGVGIRYCHTPSYALALISLVVFAYSAWAANVLTLPSDIFTPEIVATVTGTCGTLAGVGGILTTFLAGRTIDRYSYAPVFVGLGCLPLLAALSSLLVLGRDHSNPLWSTAGPLRTRDSAGQLRKPDMNRVRC